MKKWEKEILAKQIQDEGQVTIQIEFAYKEALDEINDKILALKSRDQIQSVIYQLKYQEELQKQIQAAYDKLSQTWYTTIDEYLKDCYEDSFYSTMYSLHQEGIPLIFPFSQTQVAQASAQDMSVLSKSLSKKLYSDTYDVAKQSIDQISKGLAMNESYGTIAKNISNKSSIALNNALRITRTEAHRITNEVKMKTIAKAQDKGADIVKQWDSTIDKRTRSTHIELDGQLREIDQPFKIPSSGATSMYPGGFGIAKEDINCRCALLERARWALDKSEVEKMIGNLDGVPESQLDEWAKKFGVTKEELIKKSNGIIESDGSINHRIKAKSYNEFKKKYQTKAIQQAALLAAQAKIQQQTVDFDEFKKNAVRFDNGYDADKYHKDKNFVQSRWDNDLTENERKGIVTYTSSAYSTMNRDLRSDKLAGTRYEKEINAATKGLEKTLLAEDTVIFRGMTGGIDDFSIWSGIPKSELSKKSVQDSLVGTKLLEKGFMSTGTNAGSAWSGLKLEVYLPKGSQAMYVDPISQYQGEYEILVQRNSTFEIKEVKTDSKGYIEGLVLMLVEQNH